MKNEQTVKQRNFIFFVYGVLVFCGLFVFWTVIDPLPVYDIDDLLYSYSLRKPIPLIHAWNPTRIFPEFFMPIISYAGALLINPLIDNYFFSLTLGHAFFASIIVTIYFVEFVLLFYRKKYGSASKCVGFGVLFILFHFIALINHGNSNTFLLYSINLTCFYFYTLSTIINATLVMHFMSFGGVRAFFEKKSLIHKAFVVIWGYFAINSNLYSSIVLASYVGTELLMDLLEDINSKKFKLPEYCKRNWAPLFVIASWFVVNVLEMFGGRAGDIGQSLIKNLFLSLAYGLMGIAIMNIFSTIFIIVIARLWLKKQGGISNTVVKFILYFSLTYIYLFLLSAAVDCSYAARPEVSLCYIFYVLLALLACFKDLLEISTKYLRTLCILLGTAVLLLIFPGRFYMNYNYSNISYEQCEALMNDVISQYKAADETGATEITLVIPKFDDASNWPICDFAGERYSAALYAHKVLDRYIGVKETIISEEKNEEYGISKTRNLFNLRGSN